MENTVVAGVAGAVVSEGRHALSDPRVKTIIDAIIEDFIAIIAFVYFLIEKAYKEIFNNDTQLVIEFERRRFRYADQHILEKNYLEDEDIPDVIETWMVENLGEQEPNVPPLPQPQAKPGSLAIFGMRGDQAPPLPYNPYQSPPGRQSEGPMSTNPPPQSSGSMSQPGSEGPAPKPIEQSSGIMIPPGATGKHQPGATQALGQKRKSGL